MLNGALAREAEEAEKMAVDVNTASREELLDLMGITEETVDSIIEARPFSSIDELTSIGGIGPRSLERLKKKGLTVGTAEKMKPRESLIKVGRDVSSEEVEAIVLVPEVSFEWGRARLEAKCDGQYYIVSKTNGAPHTLRWLKNAGTCRLSVFSVDADGQIITDTAQVLDTGQTIESYTSAADAGGIAFSGPVAKDAACILELDR